MRPKFSMPLKALNAPGLRMLLSEQRAQSEWNSVYLLIVFIIAAILIIALIKPMFKQSQDIVQNQPVLNSAKK